MMKKRKRYSYITFSQKRNRKTYRNNGSTRDSAISFRILNESVTDDRITFSMDARNYIRRFNLNRKPAVDDFPTRVVAFDRFEWFWLRGIQRRHSSCSRYAVISFQLLSVRSFDALSPCLSLSLFLIIEFPIMSEDRLWSRDHSPIKNIVFLWSL